MTQGDVLDFMLTRLKQNGTVVACGGIAAYNSGGGTMLQSANHLHLVVILACSGGKTDMVLAF